MIESMTPLWFMAFTTDMALGCLSFYLVARKALTHRYEGIGWWMGWWAFADAIGLVLNATMGTDYFFSYHQTGILTDTAINLALVTFLIMWYQDNWALNDNDWLKINQIKKEAKIRELSK